MGSEFLRFEIANFEKIFILKNPLFCCYTTSINNKNSIKIKKRESKKKKYFYRPYLI